MKERVTSAPATLQGLIETKPGHATTLFAHHMECMANLAMLMVFHLKPQATRLLYDANFLASTDSSTPEESLRETYADLVSSGQELGQWAQRLSRFAERGAADREPLVLGELVGTAHRLAVHNRWIPRTPFELDGEHSGAVAWTNFMLAAPLLANALGALSGSDLRYSVRVSFLTPAPGARVGVYLQQLLLPDRHGLQHADERPFDPMGEVERFTHGVESIVAKELDLDVKVLKEEGQQGLVLLFPAKPGTERSHL